MKLSDNAIQEFKKIYLKKFGVELSGDQANEKGLELLNFFQLIYRSIPTDAYRPVVKDYANCLKTNK